MKRFLTALAFFALAACATLAPQTFNQKMYVAYAGANTGLQVTTTLLEGKVINALDAQNVENQLVNVKAALDIARQVEATNPAGGDAKLAAALTALSAVQTYLCTKQPKGTAGCP